MRAPLPPQPPAPWRALYTSRRGEKKKAPGEEPLGPSSASAFCYYFRIAMAALAFSVARLALPALHAASASFTKVAALVMLARGACTF